MPREPSIEIPTDLPEVCEVLAQAFSVERAVREVFRLDVSQLRAMYTMYVPLLLENPGSIMFGVRSEQRLASVAVCQGPGREPPFWQELLKGLPILWRLGWRRCRLLMRLDRQFRQHSPLRPDHLRLVILGTRPEAFRRGYGSALLKRVDEHARSIGLNRVYLEADSHGGPKRLYLRHGYETVKQFDTPAGSIDIMVKTV